MTKPQGLGKTGAALWQRMTDAYDFDTWEAVVLETACRQADDVARLERELTGGLIVKGSTGQPRLAQAVTEVRQGRLALAKLLDQLRIPAEEAEVPKTGKSARAQRAAEARWSRVRSLREAREHGATQG